jgi:hypothetical protein
MSQIIPIYIPTYISDQNYNPARILPRLFFYNGVIGCEQYYIQDENFSSNAQQQFPYFDNYNVVSGSFPTTDSLSLLFNNEGASYGEVPTDSLYTTYWEKYVSLLYNPKTRLVNCSAIIPLKDYFTMELNDIVNFRGNYYHLRAINDYSLKDGSCTLQLLGPIIADTFSNAQSTPVPIPTGSTQFATASINLNELNSGSVFIDANLIVSGSPYYFSGNFTQYITGGVVGNVTMELKDGGATAWGGYTTASAQFSIFDNATLLQSSSLLIRSGSGDSDLTFPITFTAGHRFTISGSTAVVGNPTPPTAATLSWTYSVTGGPSSNGFGLRVNGSLVESRSSTSSGTRTVNVGDTIYVVVSCNGCSGGNAVANAYCGGIITDASCTPGVSSTTLTSYSYTVVSGDVGTTLTLNSFAACDGGCL